MSWEELRSRLAGRRGVRVEPERIVVRFRLRMLLIGLCGLLLFGGFIVSLYATGRMREEFANAPMEIAFGHLALLMFSWMVLGVARRPAVVVDGEGLRFGRLMVPWEEIRCHEYVWRGRGLGARPVVRLSSPVLDALSPLHRSLALRRARRDHVLRGARVGGIDTGTTPLSPEELLALFRDPQPGAVPPRGEQSWQVEAGALSDVPGVVVDGHTLEVLDGGEPVLRIDAQGVHARMPTDWRTVSWAELAEVSWVGPRKRPAAVLFLRPGVTPGPLPGRFGRLVRQKGRPAALVRWHAGMPFDLLTFGTLAHVHPRSRLGDEPGV